MLTIPGVEITVVKELVPRGLGAAGVLGVVGCAEKPNTGAALRELTSLSEFRELFGAGTTSAMPEVELAFANGLKAVVCAALPANAGVAAFADMAFDLFAPDDSRQATTFRVRARAAGVWGNDLHVRVVTKGTGAAQGVDVLVFTGAADARADKPAEVFRNLSPRVGDERFFLDVVNAESGFIALPLTVPPFAVGGRIAPANTNAALPPLRLANGAEPLVSAYTEALERLETQPQIDMVIASNRIADPGDATELASAVISHCDRMSRKAANRIGIGQIPPHGTARPDIPGAAAMAAALTSDRFILTAPSGYAGAVAGLLSKLRYFESPTFKTLRGIAAPNYDFSDGDLKALLTAGLMPVDTVPRKGVAVVRGIATSQYQVNVQRTADRAVRTVQNIAIDYVGLLNTQAQRSALRQRIEEAFNAMTREGALVPSADGLSPPYEVEVTASNADAAAGIVRIGVAVRPVRAIDYIYATINVRAF